MQNFEIGYIVKGRVCGVFVVVGFKTIGGQPMIVCKEVNPNNHSEMRHSKLYFGPSDIIPL